MPHSQPPDPSRTPSQSGPVDLDLELTEFVPPPATRAGAGAAARPAAQQDVLERIRDLDRRVGALLGELEGAVGGGRRMALGSLLASSTLRDLLPRTGPAAGREWAAPEDVDRFATELKRARGKYEDRVFKFGIVGFQSSGKSYLISALFDQMHFLPSLDEATTSVVTRIRYPFHGESTDTVDVLFHNEAGKNEFLGFLNRINATERLQQPVRVDDVPGQPMVRAAFRDKEFFLKCENPRRDLAKYRLIKEVHIRQASPFLTDSTEIIDLPGLGGPYALLDETTMSYLDEVDAVLFISSINHNWVKTDTEIFQRLANRPNVMKKVFFVLSKVDMPGSNIEKSIHTFHSLLEEFVGGDIPKGRIHYVSAWMALHDRIENQGQRSNLQTTANAFANQDPSSFYVIRDEALRKRLEPAFEPRNGAIAGLRDGLYRFFSTHKRLLQLNEVMHQLAGPLAAFRARLMALREAAGAAIGSHGADEQNREIQWILRQLALLFDAARYAFADVLDGLEPHPTDRSPDELEGLVARALTRALDETGLTAEPDRPRERREWVEQMAPRLAHYAATETAEWIVEPTEAGLREALLARLQPFVRSFPEPLHAPFARQLAQWPNLLYAGLRTQLAPRVLQAAKPGDGAVGELEPFREGYVAVVAESLWAVLRRFRGEMPAAAVGAWDALRRALAAFIQRDVAEFYRRNPDAPRPLVESPEALLAELERIVRDLATHETEGRTLDSAISALIQRL